MAKSAQDAKHARPAQQACIGSPLGASFGQTIPSFAASVQCTTSARASSLGVGPSRQQLNFVPRAGGGEVTDDEIEVDLKVTGMVCSVCAGSVTTGLEKLDDIVKAVTVDLDSGVVTVVIKGSSMVDAIAALPTLVAAVTDAGFEAEPIIA